MPFQFPPHFGIYRLLKDGRTVLECTGKVVVVVVDLGIIEKSTSNPCGGETLPPPPPPPEDKPSILPFGLLMPFLLVRPPSQHLHSW